MQEMSTTTESAKQTPIHMLPDQIFIFISEKCYLGIICILGSK